MTKAGTGLRSLSAAAIVLVTMFTAGCGDDTGTATGEPMAGNSVRPSFPINRIPWVPGGGASIAGSPPTTAVAGQPYSFQPQIASTAFGTAKFSIENLPLWAEFNSSTGSISGTPSSSQLGKYAGISISLINGAAVVALPAFSITVISQSNAGSVTLSWQAPTENADGTPLVDLKGYKVHYGAKSKTYSSTVQVANPGLTTYVVQNLPAGEYYFALTSYNSAGAESSLSPEVSTMVD